MFTEWCRVIVAAILFTFVILYAQFFYLHNGKVNGNLTCDGTGYKCSIFNALHYGSSIIGSQDFSVNSFGGNGNGNGYGAMNVAMKKFQPMSTSFNSDALRPRHNFKSYEDYLQLQLKKTLNPKLRKLWTS